MKTKLFLIALLISIISVAQNGINYKALIKDANNNVVNNQIIDMVFNIELENTTIYSESQQITTDDNGIAIAVIGSGTIISGDFNTIDWKGGNAELNVQIDLGDGFIDFGNSDFNAVPYAIQALNMEGLETLDEGNGLGWRLAGSNPYHYGDIGLNAVDLSYSFTPSSVRGATGAYSIALGSLTEASGTYSTALGRNTIASESSSTAMGNNTTASGISSLASGNFSEATGNFSTAMGGQTTAIGDYTVAMGSQTTAVGDFSVALGKSTIAHNNGTAMGNGTEASGSYSTAMGIDTEASGIRSTAMGNATEASGGSSTAMGNNTIASGSFSLATGSYTSATGLNSTAMGNGTTAYSYLETVIGRYNTSYTPNSVNGWNNNDRLFVIGNGESGAPSNAMVVLKNGNTGVGTDAPQELFHISGGRLRIGSEIIEDGGSDILAFSSSLVPTEDEADRLGGPNRKWLDVYAANGTIQTSDRRSKTNIIELKYGLEEVLKMQPVSFNWKNKNNPDTKLGLIAQDLQILIPEVIHSHIWEKDKASGVLTKKELDRLGVYYSDLVPVLIKAIQEQNKIIETQGAEIKASKTDYEALLSRIEIIESKSSN